MVSFSIMKQLRYFAFACSLFLLAGCGFEGIFDGSDKEVFAPVNLPVESGSLDNTFFHTQEFIALYSNTTREIMLENSIDPNKDFAIVLNDSHYLHDVEEDGHVIKWPDIDFNKYSLVLGRFFPNSPQWYIKDQRAKVVFGKTKIYLHFVKHGDGVLGITTPVRIAAIYPKLPEGPAEIVTWMEDVTIAGD